MLPVTLGPSLLSVAAVFLLNINLVTATLLYYASAGVAIGLGLRPMIGEGQLEGATEATKAPPSPASPP